MASDAPRFFVPAKTRNITPFFALPGAQYFSGGILGLFPQPSCPLTLDQAVTFLNSDHYRSLFAAMFLTTADKLILQPATLEDMPFPKSLAQAEAFLARS